MTVGNQRFRSGSDGAGIRYGAAHKVVLETTRITSVGSMWTKMNMHSAAAETRTLA